MLPTSDIPERVLRAAFDEIGLDMPFEHAMQKRAIAIGVRNFAQARRANGGGRR